MNRRNFLKGLTLGGASRAESGNDPDLPLMECSVNAFTRLLWGVRQASSLALTDELNAPADLLARLDETIVLQPPNTGWDF